MKAEANVEEFCDQVLERLSLETKAHQHRRLVQMKTEILEDVAFVFAAFEGVRFGVESLSDNAGGEETAARLGQVGEFTKYSDRMLELRFEDGKTDTFWTHEVVRLPDLQETA